MHAFVLLQMRPSAVDTATAALAERPGFLGLEELPAPDATGFTVTPAHQVLEFGSPQAREFADWLAADQYRAQPTLWLRAYVEVADTVALRHWLAEWRRDFPAFPPEDAGEVPAQNYVAIAQAPSTGQNVGRRWWVGPPWAAPPPDRQPIIIEPGMAFGAGDHPTTRLCLALMEDLATALPSSESKTLSLTQSLSLSNGSNGGMGVGSGRVTGVPRILDLGTGSGVLAIAAAKLWPACDLWLSDLDPQCAPNAERNFALNGLADFPRHARWGEPALPAGTGSFDLVVANIYSEVLRSLVNPVADLLRPGGQWIVSGLLAGPQLAEVRAAWAGQFIEVETRRETQECARLDATAGLAAEELEWVALRLVRRADRSDSP